MSLCIVEYDRLVKQTYAQVRKLFIEHLLYAGTIFHIFNTLLFFFLSSEQPRATLLKKKKKTFFSSQIKILRHREGKRLAQGHTANK